ncbi:hypothetical protein [Frankia tisae]|uniref:hypothetical protein n=1 Tax=Frankia tisae TaxID=2950104 RepID=UPI0021C19A65|nr:hypothetical protein [Frankia tisae]
MAIWPTGPTQTMPPTPRRPTPPSPQSRRYWGSISSAGSTPTEGDIEQARRLPRAHVGDRLTVHVSVVSPGEIMSRYGKAIVIDQSYRPAAQSPSIDEK